MTHDQDEVFERRLDWALGEREGRDAPPDVVDAVMGRLDPTAQPPGRSGLTWLLAALVVFGVGAVFAVSWAEKSGQPPQDSRSEAVSGVEQDPLTLPEIEFVRVDNAAEIDALPADTIAVDGLDLDDEAVGGLARLTKLRYLRLRSGVQTEQVSYVWPSTPGGYVQNGMPFWRAATNESNRRSVTDAGLAQLQPLAELEVLMLVGTVEVKGPGLRHLAALPKLRELQLICQDTSDAGLQQLPAFPSLRRLHIESNCGFLAAGVEAIADCRRLEGLVLNRCQQLYGGKLLPISRLTALRELRLLGLDGGRSDSRRALTAAEQAVHERWRQRGVVYERVVTDEVLEGILRPLKSLEILDLTFTAVTPQGFEPLASLTRLREVRLANNAGMTTGCLRFLTPAVRWLDISDCPNLDATVGAEVSRCFPELEVLRLRSNDRLVDIEAICSMPTLRVLDLAGGSAITADMATHLAKCGHLRELDIRGCVNLPLLALREDLSKFGVAVETGIW